MVCMLRFSTVCYNHSLMCINTACLNVEIPLHGELHFVDRLWQFLTEEEITAANISSVGSKSDERICRHSKPLSPETTNSHEDDGRDNN